MFDLEEVLKNANITKRSFSRRLNISMSVLREIIDSGNDELKSEMYFKYVKKCDDIRLSSEVLSFYRKFFTDEREAKELIKAILSYEKSNVPRKMINLIKRLISLADEQKRDSLKILFIITCIEALHMLENPDSTVRKYQIVMDFFENFIDKEDKDFILRKFKRSLADMKIKNDAVDGTELNIEIFARMIVAIRNKVVHQGVYWDFSFPTKGDDFWLMQFIEVEESVEEYKLVNKGQISKPERIYEMTLKYKEIRNICIKGMINFLRTYFDGILRAEPGRHN